MNNTYDYLKKYIGHNDLRGTYFLPVKKSEIEEAEKKIGRHFPTELKLFYKEIGSGILSCGEKYPEMKDDYLRNDILPPKIIADYMLGVLDHPDGYYYMSESSYEDLQPGFLPFFEMYDSSRYLIMKLDSDNPNAVWDDFGEIKIEDSFEKFIWRLYYESPSFYEDIMEQFYKDQEKNEK